MYQTLLILHSLFRWLVLISLLICLYRAGKGLIGEKSYGKIDDAFRYGVVTITHAQFLIGMILYTQSPVVKHFWNNFEEASRNREMLFFGLIHILLMSVAVILITIGSALAKRKRDSKEKFKTLLIWFLIAAAIIVIAIPWPFSPISVRPFFRF